MRLKFLKIALIPILLWGCATATLTTGSEFSSSVVPRIHKGVTTTSQILHWLGEPCHKEPVSPTETMWLYAWSRPAADPNVVPFGHRAIGATGYKKTLWLIIRNDIVVSYTYEEGII